VVEVVVVVVVVLVVLVLRMVVVVVVAVILRFEVLIALLLKIQFCCDVMLCFGQAFPNVSKDNIAFIFRVTQFESNGTKDRYTTTLFTITLAILHYCLSNNTQKFRTFSFPKLRQ